MKYTVMGLVDATVLEDVEADTPEQAYELGIDSLHASVCHQCSDELQVGEIYAVRVLDADGEEVFTDEDERISKKELARLRRIEAAARAYAAEFHRRRLRLAKLLATRQELDAALERGNGERS